MLMRLLWVESKVLESKSEKGAIFFKICIFALGNR